MRRFAALCWWSASLAFTIAVQPGPHPAVEVRHNGALVAQDAARNASRRLGEAEGPRAVPLLVAVAGGGPSGALAAILLSGSWVVETLLQVDVYERHSPEECGQYRRFFVDQPEQDEMRSWGLNPSEVKALRAHFEPTVREVAYCALVEALLRLAESRGQGAPHVTLKVHRPRSFTEDMAADYDWVVGATGFTGFRGLRAPGVRNQSALTPAKLAVDLSWDLNLSRTAIAPLSRRLFPLLSSLDSLYLTDQGTEGVGPDHRQLAIPDPGGRADRQLVWAVLLPSGLPSDSKRLRSMRATGVQASDFCSRHSLSKLRADVDLITKAVREFDAETMPLLTARVMQEVVRSPVEWATRPDGGGRVLLVGEAAWSRDTPFRGDSLPNAWKQAREAVRAVLGNLPGHYGAFLDNELAARRRELAELRRGLAAAPAPDVLELFVYGLPDGRHAASLVAGPAHGEGAGAAVRSDSEARGEATRPRLVRREALRPHLP